MICLQICNLKDKTGLFLAKDRKLSSKEIEEIHSILKRRVRGEPLQYILGVCYFWGLPFFVDKNVLIPRPETELIIEKVINNQENVKTILDIGTGSGCISIALKKELCHVQIDAVDISSTAIEIAERNAKMNNVKVNFIQSDIFSNVTQKYDLILSNPPYVGKEEYEILAKEIQNYEPRQALLAEKDGLEYYEKILKEAHKYLNEKGKIIFEIGADQAIRIKELALKNNYHEVCTEKDLNEFDRIMIIKR